MAGKESGWKFGLNFQANDYRRLKGDGKARIKGPSILLFRRRGEVHAREAESMCRTALMPRSLLVVIRDNKLLLLRIYAM